MRTALAVLLAAALTMTSSATVFINEVFINPPGQYDDTREYIELLGTPGMKLDGYALTLANGTEQKFWPEGTPYPGDQEFDEFFSLDGLQLGPNGMLVVGIGLEFYYVGLLPDTNFQRWNTIWNGGLDTPGKLQNDGSNTFFLIRNRPGDTEADDTGGDLRWGKDISHDTEYDHHVEDPQNPGQYFDQWGNGNIDKGEEWCVCVGGEDDGLPCDNGCPGGVAVSGTTQDLKGASTPDDVSDDLEVVDEVSYEHGRGWEYDTDGRHVDAGSTQAGLPYRHVHALDDPKGYHPDIALGLNPDALTRVDYRTKGDGWAPAAGAVGEMPNGNNWQDTATEQWIRGEAIRDGSIFFYWNLENFDVDAVQPYYVHVPLWLDDGTAPDYDFSADMTYQISAGRLNPLATPFIPGDVDRDGDCDAEDIAKTAAVFGDDDWIFSNSYADAPEGDSGDPATQTRPWDVDGNGEHGIEACDLQWTLNFRGDTTGQIVGVTYDSETPAATGVVLNPNTGVVCTVSISADAPLDSLSVSQTATLTVAAEITAGANTAAGEENGVMQFVHDLAIDTAGVLRVVDVVPVAPFATTRAALQSPAGTNGDGGMQLINGYTTAFDQGLAGPAALYEVTVQAIGAGSATLTLGATAAPNFAASVPDGMTVGHTELCGCGRPEMVVYPVALDVVVGPGGGCAGDSNCDGGVNWRDIDFFVAAQNDNVSAWQALYASVYGQPPTCSFANNDVDGSGTVNWRDIDPFVAVQNTTCP